MEPGSNQPGCTGEGVGTLTTLLCQQQLEQLQKELNFLEEDIKRVEVRWR